MDVVGINQEGHAMRRAANPGSVRWSERRAARALLASCVAIAASGSVRSALALSCARDEELRAPPDGATNVPLNTLIWGGPATSALVLRGPDGREVEGERRLLPAAGLGDLGTGLPVMFPVEPLLPNTTYTVEEKGGSRQFTTGDAIDTEPPPPAQLIASASGPGRLDLEFAVEDILAGELNPASAEFASVEDVLLPPSFGDGYHALDADKPVFRWLTPASTLRFRVGSPCGNWPTAGYTMSMRFGAFDLAGNFSGWTDVPGMEVPLPEARQPIDDGFTSPAPPPAERAEGCSAAPARANTASRWTGLLAVLMGLGLRALFDPRPGEARHGSARRRDIVSRRAR